MDNQELIRHFYEVVFSNQLLDELRRGNADAVRFVHRFGHFFGEFTDLVGDFSDGEAGLAKKRIRISDYFQRHVCSRIRVGIRG